MEAPSEAEAAAPNHEPVLARRLMVRSEVISGPGLYVCEDCRRRAAGALKKNYWLSSPALDVRLITALQVLQVLAPAEGLRP